MTKKKAMLIHLIPDGQIEVGTGKPGYRWVNAYSQLYFGEHGTKHRTQPPLTRKHWYEIANRDSCKCVFHANEAAAEKALKGD
jgi:hypothetical protein